MPKRLSLEEQIQTSHFTLTDIQQKALQEYSDIKKNHGEAPSLDEQIEISKMLDAKMKMVIDATGKQIELMKVHERALRPSETDDAPNTSNSKARLSAEDLKRIREEINQKDEEYQS